MVKPAVVHNQDGPEATPPTTRPTGSFYLTLAFVVVPFCAVTPASWCYVVYSLYTGAIWSLTSRQCILFAIALAEVCLLLDPHMIFDHEPWWARIFRCSSAYTTITWRNSFLGHPPLDLQMSLIYKLHSVVCCRPAWPVYPKMALTMTKRWTFITLEVLLNSSHPSLSTTPVPWISVHT